MEPPSAPLAQQSPGRPISDGERWAKRWALVAGIALLIAGLLPSWTVSPGSDPSDSFDFEGRWVWPWEDLRPWVTLLVRTAALVAGLVTLMLVRGALPWFAGRTLLAVATALVGVHVTFRYTGFMYSRLHGWQIVWEEAIQFSTLAIGASVCLRARRVLSRFVTLLGLLGGLVLVSSTLVKSVLDGPWILFPHRSTGWVGFFQVISIAAFAFLGVAGLLVWRRPKAPDRLGSFTVLLLIAYAILVPLCRVGAVRASSLESGFSSGMFPESLPAWLLIAARAVLQGAGAFALPVVGLAAFLEAVFVRRAARTAASDLHGIFE